MEWTNHGRSRGRSLGVLEPVSNFYQECNRSTAYTIRTVMYFNIVDSKVQRNFRSCSAESQSPVSGLTVDSKTWHTYLQIKNPGHVNAAITNMFNYIVFVPDYTVAIAVGVSAPCVMLIATAILVYCHKRYQLKNR